MTLDQFIANQSGKSVLYAPSPAREYLRGQCVQLAALYVTQVVGKPVLWRDAAEWWYSNLYPEHYERIPNTAGAVPRPGDLIIWDRSLANSGGAGHIAICVSPRPGTGTFVSFDSNWGGKTAKLVTHNYNKVIGWLRPRVITPPAPSPQTKGDEMIANTDQAVKIYKMLRPNGTPSQAEIDGTAGKRSFAEFLNSAQAEVQARDLNLRTQADALANMSNTVNAQNATITDLTVKLNDANATAAQKQHALDEALTKLGSQNAQIATYHDEVVDLQNEVTTTQPKTAVNKPNLFIRLLSLFVKKKS